ncbi:YheC/YheD family endospore coat-associated protein [Paenibacillus senegalensis]|uniref:YheC/YheD family endospore coat-associated protein n=1 Tax=Paenibacillus senegalensis TaxID=1465766 RepID=UPI000289D27A|nr:YheC/YheD family protein [Paenibacillus senegalensis]
MLAAPFLIGILACRGGKDLPFCDADFYMLLIRHAKRLGMKAFVFTPEGLAPDQQSVEGFVWTGEQRWSTERLPLPDLIYDRFFSTNPSYRNGYHTLMNIMAHSRPKPLVLGNRLMGKWAVHRSLSNDRRLRPYLPKTSMLATFGQLLEWLERESQVIVKPDGGTQGKGIILLRKHAKGFEAAGRTSSNLPYTCSFAGDQAMLDWLVPRLNKQYLLQTFLHLTNAEGNVFDIRSLVQKNGKGLWSHTGMAVRLGEHGSVTANLHSGGCAVPAAEFLHREFGEHSADRLISQLRDLSLIIAEVLEHYYGRLAELGIDFGVDRHARLWIIEVNSKPGRAVFRNIKDKRARWLSLHQPMAYAKYLLAHRNGWRKHTAGTSGRSLLTSLG